MKKHFLFLTLIGLGSCGNDDNSGSGNIATPVSLPSAAHIKMNVGAIDAATGAPIEGVTLSIVDNGNKFFTETQKIAEDGFESFTGKDISESLLDGKTIKISAKAAGYVSTNKAYTLNGSALFSLPPIKMVSTTSLPPSGVKTTSTKILSDEEGHALNGMNVKVQVSEESTGSTPDLGSVQLTLDNDTSMLNAKNEPVTGDLDVSVTSFTAQDINSLTAFPGGFNAVINNAEELAEEEGGDEVINNNGNVDFTSAGFVSVEIENEKGDEVKNFNGGKLKVEMEIPTSTLNPKTGKPVQPGEQIPIWSFDVDTGEWRYEQEASKEVEITQGRDGFLNITYFVKHLSYWNLDYFSNDQCENNVFIKLTDQNGNPYPRLLNGVGSFSSGGWANEFFNVGNGAEIEFSFVPSGRPLDFKFTDALTGKPVCVTGVDECTADTVLRVEDACSMDQLSLFLPIEDKTILKDLQIRSELICENNSDAPPIPVDQMTYRVWQAKPNNSVISYATVNQSEITLSNLIDNDGERQFVYNARVINPINNKITKRLNFKLDESPIVFQFPTTCQTPTGSTSGSTGSGNGG